MATDLRDLLEWRGEYDIRSPVGVLRFVFEIVVGIAVIIRAGAHVIGVLDAHREHIEDARDEMDVHPRVLWFCVDSPDISFWDEFRIRVLLGWAALFAGLLVATHSSTDSVVGAAILVANWIVLVGDPVWLFAERQIGRNQT